MQADPHRLLPAPQAADGLALHQTAREAALIFVEQGDADKVFRQHPVAERGIRPAAIGAHQALRQQIGLHLGKIDPDRFAVGRRQRRHGGQRHGTGWRA